VIIPSLNTCDMLRSMLSSLEPQLAGVHADVVVVDMSSTDGTVQMVESQFTWARVLPDVPNRGYGAAVNAGLKATDARWVLACNSDLEFRQDDAVRTLLAVAQERTDAAVLGARLFSADGTPARSAFSLPGRFFLAVTFCAPLRYLRRLNAWALGYLDDAGMHVPTSVGWVSGALLLIDRCALSELGAFDERFFMNCEEVDLCARMHAGGRDVLLVPAAHVVHLGGGSTPVGGRGLTWLAEGQARYSRKHFGTISYGASLVLAWLALASSLPVWAGRALLAKQSFADAVSEARMYVVALKAAGHV